MSEKVDIYSKIFFRDVGNFFRHLCELVLRHQMRVSNYFVNSFYSASVYVLWRGASFKHNLVFAVQLYFTNSYVLNICLYGKLHNLISKLKQMRQ